MSEYSKVCQDLDSLVIEYFGTINELAKRRQKLEDLLSQGQLQMSRARYNMGNKAVSCLQLPEDYMQPLCHISVAENYKDSDSLEFSNHRNVTFENDCKDGDSDLKVKDVGKDKEGIVKGKGLRKRNVEKSEQKENEALDNSDKKVEDISAGLGDMRIGKKSGNRGGCQDPLNWFGVLVPQSLRQSQLCYKESINVVCEIAGLQNKLEKNVDKYKELLPVKKSLSA